MIVEKISRFARPYGNSGGSAGPWPVPRYQAGEVCPGGSPDRAVGPDLKKAGKYDQALTVSLKALGLLEEALGPAHETFITTLLESIADTYDHLGSLDKAMAFYKGILGLSTRALVPKAPLLLAPLNNLAKLHCKKIEYDKALPLLQRAPPHCYQSPWQRRPAHPPNPGKPVALQESCRERPLPKRSGTRKNLN